MSVDKENHLLWLKGVLVLPLLLLCSFAHGQHFNFKSFSTAEGLPQNFIYSLNQDQQGYLWIGTGDGLSRFDGSEFTTFRQEDGLAGNFITRSVIDGEGRLWLAHNQGGLSVLADNQFKEVVPDTGQYAIEGLWTAKDGSIGTVTQGGEIALCSVSGRSPVEIQGFQPSRLISWSHYRDDLWWAGTSEGLFLLEVNGKGGKVLAQLDDLTNIKAVIGLEEHCLGLSLSGGLILIQVSDSWDLSHQPAKTDQFLDGPGYFLSKDQHDQVMVGSGSGIFKLRPSHSSDSLILIPAYGRFSGLESDHGTCVLYDREGQIWIGSRGAGLSLLPYQKASFASRSNDLPLTATGMAYSPKRGLVVGNDQSIAWLQFNDPEVAEDVKGSMRAFALPEGLNITALAADEEGTIWAGTEASGLYFLASPFRKENWKKLESVSPRRIAHLSFDQEGTLWVATHAEGAIAIDPKSGDHSAYTFKEGLFHNEIHAIFHDSQNRHWLIPEGNRLQFIDGENIVDVTSPNNQAIRSACLDANQSLWIATGGEGIYRRTGDSWKQFTIEQGLPSNYLQGIFCDRDNRIWGVTRDQLAYLVPGQSKFRIYSGVDPSDHQGFVPHKAAENDQGRLFFGSYSGVVSFYPALEPPQVELYVRLKSLIISGDEKSLEQSLELPFAKYRIRFGFDGIRQNRNSPTWFRYRLLGYEEDWNPPTTEPFAYFTNLSEGDYTLEIQAGTAPDQFGEAVQSWSFTILTPFWKTTWFYVLCCIGVLAGILLFVRIRTYRLKVANQQLEATVAERTQEIRKQNEELERFTYAVSHDLKTPAINIAGLLKMLQATDPEINDHRKEIYDLLNNASSHLQENLLQLMQVIKAKGAGAAPKSEVKLPVILDEIRKNIYIILEEAQAELVVNWEVETAWFNRSHLYSALYNLITNAVKYRSPERKPVVKVSSRQSKQWLILEVEDNGLGMDLEKDYDKLFGMFQRIHAHTEGSGVGLHLVKKIIDNSGGKIEVDSTPGKGSKFSVYLPLQ